MNYTDELYGLIIDVTKALEKELDMSKVKIVDCGLPHLPTSLKPGTMAVYAFIYGDRFLKIGKAGSKSNARFLSQHYNLHSSQSNLATSILRDPEMTTLGITESTVGTWINKNCNRIDILLDSDLGCFALELVEAILHYKYEPKYEGFSSQRN